jgi:hypothetical protein
MKAISRAITTRIIKMDKPHSSLFMKIKKALRSFKRIVLFIQT